MQTTYTLPGGRRVRTTLQAPASHLSLTKPLPTTVDRGSPLEFAWSGAEARDVGAVSFTIWGGLRDSGINEVAIGVDVPVQRGHVTIPKEIVALLPPGPAGISILALSWTIDNYGINHVLYNGLVGTPGGGSFTVE